MYSIQQTIRDLARFWEQQRILEHLPLYGEGLRGLTRKEIAIAASLAPNEVSRILRTLYYNSLVTQRPARGKKRYWKTQAAL